MVNKIQQRINSDHDLREILFGTSWVTLLKVFGLVAAYLLSFAVSRTLGADAWGSFTLSRTLLVLFAIIGGLGMDTALLRLTSQLRAQEKDNAVRSLYFMALRVVLPIAFLVTIILFSLSPTISREIFNKPNLTPQFRVASLTILPYVLSMINWQILRGQKRIKEYAFFALVARHLFPVFIFLGLLTIIKADIVVIFSLMISMYLIAIVSTILIFRYTESQSSYPNPGISYRDLFAISLPLLLAASLAFIMGWITTFMLGIYMDEADVGIYAVALKLGTSVSFVLGATAGITAVKLAEFYGRGDRVGMGKTARWISRISLLGALPIFTVLVVAPSFWLGIFGEEFKVASVALIVLAFGYLFDSWAGTTGYILQMTGHQVFFQNATLGTVLVLILMNYFLIPRYGITGAALSTSVSVVLWNLCCSLYIRSRLKINVFFNPFDLFHR